MICACTSFGLLVIFPGVFYRYRMTRACPVTTDLILRVDVRTTMDRVLVVLHLRLPGYCNQGMVYLCHRYCAAVLPKLHEWGSFNTSRSCGYGYRSVKELKEVPTGYCGTDVQNSQKIRAGAKIIKPYPGILVPLARAELSEALGTGAKVVRNFQTFRVRV